jgi:hypothetical protein
MMFRPFWQRAMSSFDFTAVEEFVAEAIPENEYIEYKAATYNKQNQRVEFTNELLETVVAFANSGGGMLFYGVDEDAAKNPCTGREVYPCGITRLAHRRGGDRPRGASRAPCRAARRAMPQRRLSWGSAAPAPGVAGRG